MIASQVVIDRTSHNWVHHSFNVAFLSSTRAATRIFIGHGDSSAFQAYDGEKEEAEPGLFASLRQLLRASRRARSRNILFLCMSSRDIILVAMLRALRFDVSYVMHKLNLRSRLLKRHLRFLYRVLDSVGVSALCLEPPHPVFRQFRIIDLDLYGDNQPDRSIRHIPVPYRRIAYVGAPDAGKNFPLLEQLARKLAFEVVLFSDDPSESQFEHRPHTNFINDCDYIWGYYRNDHYQGIQSGISYVSLDSGIPILTNQSIGFLSFATRFPEHCLSLSGERDLEDLLVRLYGKRNA